MINLFSNCTREHPKHEEGNDKACSKNTGRR